QDTVIKRRVGVEARLEQLVKLLKGPPAIALVSIDGQDGPVLPIGQGDLAGREPDHRVLHVSGRQGGIGVVRRRRKPGGERQQVFALFVEHVLLLPVQILDRKTVDRQFGRLVQPLLNRRQWNVQEL